MGARIARWLPATSPAALYYFTKANPNPEIAKSQKFAWQLVTTVLMTRACCIAFSRWERRAKAGVSVG